jgi:hypothetical protein
MAETRTVGSLMLQPFESNDEARADMQAFLQLSDPTRVIDAFGVELDLVAALEPARSSLAAVTDKVGIDVGTGRSILRVVNWLCRNTELDLGAVATDLRELGLLAADRVDVTKQLFAHTIETLGPAFLRRWGVTAIMSTFRTVNYACSQRVLEAPDDSDPPIDKGSSLVPVCIVRIQGDEGEPFVFQCTSADIDRLREVFDDARRLLGKSLSKGS